MRVCSLKIVRDADYCIRRVPTALRFNFIVLAFLVAAVGATSTAARAASSTEQQLEAIQSRIETVSKQLDTAQGARGKLEASLRQAEESIASAAIALHDTQQRLSKQRAKLETLNHHAAQQQQTVQVALDALRSQIESAYRMGRQPALQLFLNQQSPAELGRMLAYYDYLNHDRQSAIDQARQKLAGLIATRQQVNAERLELQSTLATQRSKEAALKQAEQQRRTALAKLDSVIVDKRNRLKTLQENEQRLRNLLSSVGNAVVNDGSLNSLSQRSFHELYGRLPWPTAGTLSVRFNTPRSGSDGSLRWQGVFIRAPKGQSIHAIDAGRVVFANWLQGYGLLLIIDHGAGYMSLYGHVQAIYRSVGTWVRAGETVASVGNSGGQNTDGLYFAIRHKGAPLDPSRWCSGTPRTASR